MKRFSALFLSITILLMGCSRDFIHDREYRKAVNEDFLSRNEILSAAGVDLRPMELTKDEMQALEFLYAYMPLGDIVNRPTTYYLSHYRMMRQALEEMPWGDRVPERELRHFVLPVRVNNENLDDSRQVFFEELAPRVKGLSMYDAVLEVNHWCHEKAVYMPSDRRTSSPLATIKTAYGRCGEESTLLVAALRSVGIPARQVYTPRWAHTDSNHAWVEAWVDGDWYFLGACEPEPVLNLGWFNAPASRGMLMHTNVFGRYDGPEEVVRRTPNHTEINVIENYAPASAGIRVRVLEQDGRPADSATVEYKIYNYSNFETVATKYTDRDGFSSLTAGLGDMMVHASKDGSFGFSKVTFGKDKELVIVLKYKEGDVLAHMELEVVPPVEKVTLPEVSEQKRKENSCRMEYEDSLRNAYVATFYDESRAQDFAVTLTEKRDVQSRISKLLISSRGNHAEITAFLTEAMQKGSLHRALPLLESLTEKDLRDTPKQVLDDHLYNVPEGERSAFVFCPRVDTELLTTYREYFYNNIPESLADTIRTDPALFVSWCKDKLSLHDEMSLRYVQLAPRRVWETRLADKWSREIFFVAMCRSFGVSAWKDAVTGVVQYEHLGKVYDVDFDAQQQKTAPQGKLQLVFERIPLLDDPKYKSHFTLSKYVNGSFQLLNFAGTWSELFREPREMDCGFYLLTSGSRMSAGNVCADMAFFSIEEGQTTVEELVVRDDTHQVRVIGNFDSESRYVSVQSPSALPDESAEAVSILSTTGRGYFAVVLADYGTEPTNHAFMDISAAASQLESWGRPILVLFASREDCRKFRQEQFKLPSTVCYGIDTEGTICESIAREMKTDGKGKLPLILIADTFNRVVFFSQGYRIGLGEEIVRISKSL